MTEAGNLLFVQKGHWEGGKRASVLKNCCLKMQEVHKAKEELSILLASGSVNRENQRGTAERASGCPKSHHGALRARGGPARLSSELWLLAIVPDSERPT